MNASRAWLVVCCVHGAASVLVWWAPLDEVDLLTWRADHWAGQPWTLWTSAWVHLNAGHLIGNLLALGALAVFAWLVKPSLRSAMGWLTAWPLTQFSLLLWPQIGYAVGLSGVLHAGAMVVAVQLMFNRIAIRKARRWGALLALGVLVKTASERGWWYPVVWDRANDMSVVQAAHLSGVVWGLLLGLLVAWGPGWSGGGLRWPGVRA
jgi:rhomboid family GlyGly-CTERM serine protease